MANLERTRTHKGLTRVGTGWRGGDEFSLVESYPGMWSKSLHTPPPFRTSSPPPLLRLLYLVSPGQRSGPGPAGPDQTGPQGRCGCCPCCGLSSGPRYSARACGGAPASATLSTGTPLTPGSLAERGERQAGPARSQAVRAPAARLLQGAV